MRLDKDTRSMLRSALVAKGPTSKTDTDATTEEYLLIALDELDAIESLLDAQPYQNSCLTVVQIRRALDGSDDQ